jgi:hypothetical protein
MKQKVKDGTINGNQKRQTFILDGKNKKTDRGKSTTSLE